TVEGGTLAWMRAGFTLFDGVNVPSKTFGEIVELERHTPRITAMELNRRQRSGEKLAVIDGRPFAEYRKMSIPGGQCCPNGELALRIGDIVPDSDTTIVVNCAGRTRSIIGAQTLIDFGVPNPVVALENGTQGWFLAGLELEHNQSYSYSPFAYPERLDELKQKALRLARSQNVETLTAAEVELFLSERHRTNYLFDVRSPEENQRDGLPPIVHAPGGQLIQATDQWVGVKGARITLVDNEMVRAPIVAYWLAQLGHEVYVLDGGIYTARSINFPEAELYSDRLETVESVDVTELASLTDAQFVDLRGSMTFRAGHLKDAAWSIRPCLDRIPFRPEAPVVLISNDNEAATLFAFDLKQRGVNGAIRRLNENVENWKQAGLDIVTNDDCLADKDCIDFVFHTYDRHSGNADAARAYIAWETGLVDRLDAQERNSFRLARIP
ncbi:MAG: rhodanese-like domain-containing protein, partial [Arenicellales bacterium]|nr:rhodanese-like domain-containing protein [Arenicellales bacterium]